MSSVCTHPWLLALLAPLALSVGPGPVQEPAPEEPRFLDIEMGEQRPPLRITGGEELVYKATVRASIIEASVGWATLSTGIQRYRAGLLLPSLDEQGAAEKYTGWLKAEAQGTHVLYTMDADLEARYLPQAWPMIFYRMDSRGSENKKTELQIGVLEDEPRASVRKDTDVGAPPGQRLWRKPETRSLPTPHALEVMGAIWYARALIERDLDVLEFPMLTKLKLWNVTLTRGESRELETLAGRFDAVQVLLSTERHPDDVPDEDDEFEGLFGIRGDIQLWVCKRTGVPVMVTGDVPVGPITISAEILLSSYSGMPEAFAPLPAEQD